MVNAQIDQLATSADGGILLFRTNFRLHSDTEAGPESKIYRWQNGLFTKLAGTPTDWAYDPFLSGDGTIYGWQGPVPCSGLCQIRPGPDKRGVVYGVSLPAGFPQSSLRVSANGRYITADSWPAQLTPKLLDAATGVVADLPIDYQARTQVREPADDGAVLVVTTTPNDPYQFKLPGVLAYWRPGFITPAPLTTGRIVRGVISAVNAHVAVEMISPNPGNPNRRTLSVILPGTESPSPAIRPVPVNLDREYAPDEPSVFAPQWDAAGAKLIFRDWESNTQRFAIWQWDPATERASLLMSCPEGFTMAVISGDGNTIWAATAANRLLRYSYVTGATDQILGALPTVSIGFAVPGSAILISGPGVTSVEVVTDNFFNYPIVDRTPEGLWIQMPWEDGILPAVKITFHSTGNKFEAVTGTRIDQVQPHIVGSYFDNTGGYAKAVHEDFKSLVTPDSPALRGETIHVYLTGLGRLDQPLPTGAPGPLSPLLHPVAPLSCTLGESKVPLLMTYVGYAVGLVGFYQADLTIPADSPAGTLPLSCTSPNSYTAFATIAPLTVAQR